MNSAPWPPLFFTVASLCILLLPRNADTQEMPDFRLHPQSSNSTKYCGDVMIFGPNAGKDFQKLQECHAIEGFLRIQRCFLPENASLPNLTRVLDYVVLERVEGVNSLARLFPRLFVVGQRKLFSDVFSFVLFANRDLREIGPWSLKSLVRGSALVEDNVLLCTDEDAQWNPLINDKYKSYNRFFNNLEWCPFVACEEKKVCHVRPKTCKATGLLCPNAEATCHPQCLGGCFGPEDPSACVACSKFIHDGSCVSRCPTGYLIAMDFRCISRESCGKSDWVVFKGDHQQEQCLKRCPEKFAPAFERSSDDVRVCKVKLECESSEITTRNLGSEIEYCTKIKGNLIIRVGGGKDVMKQLEANLGRIKVITGYLMVANANALYSLSFLSNLTKIEGKETVYGGEGHEGYSLYIVENPYLRQLFDYESSSKTLEVKGHAFIQFNDQLCKSEIYKLRDYTGMKEEDIRHAYNGRKYQCNVYTTTLRVVPGSEVGSLRLNWAHAYLAANDQAMLGYHIFYRPTANLVSLYQDRDVCNDRALWSRSLHKVSHSGIVGVCVDHELRCLQPNTRYAVYVSGLVLPQSNTTTQSNIVYAKTYGTNPAKVKGGNVEFRNFRMRVSWEMPPPALKQPSTEPQVFYEVSIRFERYSVSAEVELDKDCNTHFTNLVDPEEEETENAESHQSTLEPCACANDISDDDALLKEQQERIHIKNEESDFSLYRWEREVESDSCEPTQPVVKEAPEPFPKVIEDKCSTPSVNWSNSRLKFFETLKPSEWIADGTGAATRNERTTESSVNVSYPPSFHEKKGQFRVIVRVRSCIGEMFPCPPLKNSSGSCALCSPFHAWTNYTMDFDDLTGPGVISWLEATKDGTQNLTPSSNYAECKYPPWSEDYEKNMQTMRFVDIERDLTESVPVMAKSSLVQTKQNLLSPGKPALLVSWNVSSELEAVTIYYRILFRSDDQRGNQVSQVCIPKNSAKERRNTFLLPISDGKQYWVVVQVRTLAGLSPIEWNEKCIEIPWNQETKHWVTLAWVAVVIAGLLLVVVVHMISVGLWNIHCKPDSTTDNNPFYRVMSEGELCTAKCLDDIDQKYWLDMCDLNITETFLGNGEFGVVFKGTFTKTNGGSRTGEEVAIKIPKSEGSETKATTRDEILASFVKEAVNMQNLDSPFVLRFIGAAAEKQNQRLNKFYIVMEYMKGGNLLKFLKDETKLVTEEKMIEIAAQVADAMAYLASKNFIHRDLAARNVLVDSEGKIFKISDFGLARKLVKDYYKHSGVLPVRSTGPEVFKNGKFYIKSDVYSYGYFLCEVVTRGEIPFKDCSRNTIMKRVLEGNPVPLTVDVERPKILCSLISLAGRQNLNERPSFLEILKILLENTSQKFKLWFQEQQPFYYQQQPLLKLELNQG